MVYVYSVSSITYTVSCQALSTKVTRPWPPNSAEPKLIAANQGSRVSKFTSKQQFIDEVIKERTKLTELLDEIPTDDKLVEVIDGMSVKDFLAHRTEWGRMMIRWLTEARAGGTPAVPTAEYKWNQLKELNASIHERFADTPLETIESEFAAVHDEVFDLIESTTDEELFTKHYHTFTGASDLATYLNSASASHYRSARRHIQKWWKARRAG